MARLSGRNEIERTAQPSLLDRLVDHEPRVASDPPLTLAESVRRAKAALRRDLEWLLNTRRTAEPAPEGLEELRRSLYHFGLPDISSLSNDSVADRMRLLQNVEDTIAAFEPRLANVHVSLVEQTEEKTHRRELHFVIEATLRMEPSPERVVFDTVFELASGEVRVKGDGGA
jgi:type VI secretion system protein ImpF